MDKYLCIHGHCYQPPREDPWLGVILPEGSAAPSINWNQRITRESYAPMARARRLDGAGRIAEVMNLYEYISFNAGPTMMNWLAQAEPETCRLMVEADAKSLARLGHGNAIAQVYHHQILPLASELDKELEVAWAVHDFTARFGRAPEGMWLAEAAVDTASLEALARHGVAFTILSPAQARETAPLGSTSWAAVNPGNLDIQRPYLVRLPSGRSIAVFFYNGPLSQAVAFEGLLADGGNFFNRLAGAARPGLTCLATDGETYGHHFTFGEMALAYALAQARDGKAGLRLTNFGAFLAANPPTMQVRLHEPSAWSCAHGVKRWQADCGCTDGGHPGWRQTWRAPLRQALQEVKTAVDQHFFQAGALCFADPSQALTDYGLVLAGAAAQKDFERDHLRQGLDANGRETAWKLLAMQQWGLASLASCAWFFDEISRIEPVNGLTYALRAMELSRATGGPDMESHIIGILRNAPSNLPEYGDGAAVWNQLVKPRQESLPSLAAQALMTLWAQDRLPAPGLSEEVSWPGVRVGVETKTTEACLVGQAHIRWNLEAGTETLAFTWPLPAGGDPLAAPLRCAAPGQPTAEYHPRTLPVNKRQALADAWVLRAEAALWAEGERRMASGAHLVTELQEAQTTFTLAPLWAGLWTPLAWAYIWGLNVAGKRLELLLLFLRQSPCSAQERQNLLRRINARALEELCGPRPDWDGLCRMVARMRELGLPEDWWSVQNHLWDHRLTTGPAAGFAALVGF